MNCRTFEGLITDLVRKGALQQTIRASALAHARGCARCGARLADEQALSAMFRIVAADTTEAPAHVESEVMSAYRDARRAVRPARPAVRPARIGYWGIAAVVALSVMGATVFKLFHLSGRGPEPASVSDHRTSHPGTAMPAGDVAPAETRAPRIPDVKSAAVKPARRGPSLKSPVAEIATDFIPLTAEAFSSMEGGQLIRVRLPRTALAVYGLPVNQELTDRPVNAQVLLGQDGVARAIRFLGDSDIGLFRTQR